MLALTQPTQAHGLFRMYCGLSAGTTCTHAPLHTCTLFVFNTILGQNGRQLGEQMHFRYVLRLDHVSINFREEIPRSNLTGTRAGIIGADGKESAIIPL